MKAGRIRAFNLRLGRRRDLGQAFVEFALVVPLVLILLMAMIDLSRYVWIESTMSHIVRVAARYAVTGNKETVSGAQLDWSDSIIYIASQANTLDNWIPISKNSSSFNIFTTDTGAAYPTDVPSGQKVTIRLTNSFSFITPFLSLLGNNTNGWNIVVEVTSRMED